MKRVLAQQGTVTVVAHMCAFGMRSTDALGEGPVQKPTRFMTNSLHIAHELERKCDGSHRHVALLGGRASAAQVYPKALCMAICRGMRKHLDAEGEAPTDHAVHAVMEMKQAAVEACRAGKSAEQISTILHGGQEAWDDSKGGGLDPREVARARSEEMEYVRKM